MERDLIQYIAENLVNETDEIRVKSRKTRNALIIQLTVAKPDMGRVIGKGGRVANAMRSLLKVMGSKTNTKVILDID
jgi:uncharacterized protein